MQYTERPHNNKSTQPDSSFENVRPVNAGQNDSHKALGFDLPQHILKGFFGKKEKKKQQQHQGETYRKQQTTDIFVARFWTSAHLYTWTAAYL